MSRKSLDGALTLRLTIRATELVDALIESEEPHHARRRQPEPAGNGAGFGDRFTVNVLPVAVAGYDEACRVECRIGNQTFNVGADYWETRDEGEWFAKMLRHALATLQTRESDLNHRQPEPAEGREGDGWRALTPGERIEAGDEFQQADGTWRAVSRSMYDHGEVWNPSHYKPARRKVTDTAVGGEVNRAFVAFKRTFHENPAIRYPRRDYDTALLEAVQAALTASGLPAEVERLREALAREERQHGETCGERDRAEEAVGALYNEVVGEWPEWSNAFDYSDARESVEDHMATLRQAHRIASAECDELRQKHHARIIEADRNFARAEAAERALAEAREDARRYQFLRRPDAWKDDYLSVRGSVSAIFVSDGRVGNATDGEALDAAIDAALAANQKSDSLAARASEAGEESQS